MSLDPVKGGDLVVFKKNTTCIALVLGFQYTTDEGVNMFEIAIPTSKYVTKRSIMLAAETDMEVVGNVASFTPNFYYGSPN